MHEGFYVTTPRILCAAYGGGHIKALLPALIELRRRGWHVDLLALTTAFGVANAAGLDPWRVCDFLAAEDEDMLEKGRELAASLLPSALVAREETEAYLAFGFASLVQRFGKAGAEKVFAEQGRSAFMPNALAGRVIEKTNPDAVLTTNSPRVEKALIDEAQSRGLPAIVLNDLLASESNHWLHEPGYADKILVFSDFVRQRLIASGHAPEKIVVTGNPAFEPMVELRDLISNRAPNPMPVVLYLSQPLPAQDHSHHVEVIGELTRIASTREDLVFHVRLHPNEDQTPEWLVPPLFSKRDVSLAQELAMADVVVTHGSTAGLEAAIAGLPVVLQHGSEVAFAVKYDEIGIAIGSPDVTGLEKAIDRAFAQGGDPNLAMLEQPAMRVADAVEDFVKRGR